MKFIVQKVEKAKVEVDGKVVGKINKGFMVLIGVKENDTKKEADYLVNKLINLRIFEDEQEKMNLSLKDVMVNFYLYHNLHYMEIQKMVIDHLL